MEVLRPATEDEAADAFVRAELESPRFRDEILAGTRGWRIGGLFGGFPDDLDWHRVALIPDEVLGLRYIHWNWWLEVSNGSRSPVDAAVRSRAGEMPGVEPEPFHALAARLGSENPPAELIAVTNGVDAPVLVEGHVRLTSYALYPEYLPPRLEILLGVSERVDEWGCY